MENGMCLEKEVRIFEFSIDLIFIPRNNMISWIRSCVGGYVSLSLLHTLFTVFIVVNLYSTFSVDISISVTNQSLFASSCCIISVTLLLFANLSSKPRYKQVYSKRRFRGNNFLPLHCFAMYLYPNLTLIDHFFAFLIR